ncbi:MAG: DUF342 domain-containing protein [Desulfobacteraceae bacterium]|nr:DUF342 domain-containing protein [Desulfobacteraceae bacterium]
MGDISEYAILVVDDDEPIVKNMRRVLRRKGFNKVISALNAEQAIGLLESSAEKFFLIMSDQRMPGMQGSEFLEKSILLSPESRRMLITGYSDFDAIVEAVNEGSIHQYISKPWDNDDLLLRIMNEHDIFQKFQERKRLFKVTKHQNARLFKLASQLKKNDGAFQNKIAKKKKDVEELKQSLVQAKEEAEFKETYLGLDELLSRTITLNKENLVQAMNIAKDETSLMVETITERNKIVFSPVKSDAKVELKGGFEDEVYEIIDIIIENVVQKVEPDLSGIGSEPAIGVVVDDYEKVPDFGTLAFNDGYVTKGEFEKAKDELETKEAEQSTGLTIDKVLVTNEFLRRKDLSRIFAKLALIEMRLLDREFAKELVDREIATHKDVDRAFRKQLNNFEESGIATLLGDLLVESEVIAPELRDEVMENQDRTGKKSKIDESSAFDAEFGAFVDLRISEDRVVAFIRVPEAVLGTEDIGPIKKLIKKRGIKFGIVDDKSIRDFVKNCKDPAEKFNVAIGKPVKIGKPAEIIYHFNTEHDSAGVVNEDGSIDFTSRGDSPFVKKGQLLAEKHPMEHAKSGVDIFGETLLVGDVADVTLECSDGAELSEDGLKVTSTISGQPSIDLKGVVSVLEQFRVRGDVDFKTGNIKFKGNVVVDGTVKEGFMVECEELIANEINGGIIRIAGDLKVSNGIVKGDIQTQGSVQAKFINNSKIFGYRNMMVTREIMESMIAISGEINNEAGRITGSTISARMGFNVKQIGTEKAEPSTIKTGADDHIKWIEEKYDKQMREIQKDLDIIIQEKIDLDDENNALHVDIASQTFAQEKITKKIDFTEKKMGEVNKEEKLKLAKELKDLDNAVKQADERIKNIFEEQDKVLSKIEERDTKIAELNVELSGLQKEKKASTEALTKTEPTPIIKVNKKIYTGTRIAGTEASMIIKNDLGMSKFEEIDTGDPENPKQITHQTMN